MRIEVPSTWETESDGDSVVLRAAPALIRFNLDRGDYPVGGGVIGATIVVHEIGDTTDATSGELLDLAEDYFGNYDNELPCGYGYSNRDPLPSRALPDYWAMQFWFCADDLMIMEVVGVTHGDPGLAIVTSLVIPSDDFNAYHKWIAWSAQDPDAPNVAPGWRRHIIPAGTLSVGIPPGWNAVDESSDPDAEGADRLTDEIVLFASDADPALSRDESAFVLVSQAPLDENLIDPLLDLDADWLAETTLPTLQKIDNLTGDVTYEIVTLPYGESVRFEYDLELASGGERKILTIVQHMFLPPGELAVLTFGLLVDDPTAYENTMATMAASFAIPEAAGAGVAGTQQSTVERDQDGRPTALDWQEVVSEFGNFAFEVPADGGSRIRSGGAEQGVWASLDLDFDIDEIYNETTVGSTGVAAIFRDAGDTSQNTDEELQDRARSLLFKETDLEGCSDPAPGSASEIFGSIPDFWEVNVYDCDDGYTLLNALGITRAESGCIMAFSIRAPAEEMPVRTWIADSVRIQVAQGIGPDEENLADLDPETQVMLVGESGRFAVVIPLDMQRDVWFLEGDGDGDGIEEFMVSPELGYFRDDRLVDPPRASIPGVRIGIVDTDFLVGLDDDDIEGRLSNVLATHRIPKNCVELGSDVVQVGGAVGKYFLTSRLCGTRYQHLVLVGAITVEPGYLIIIDLVATLDTDELNILLAIVDSIRMVEVVDPTP